MKIKAIFGCAFLVVLTGGIANADDTSALIQLDKNWGSAQGSALLESLLADDIVSLDADGISGKAQMVEAAENDDSAPEPYVAGDFKVNFLSDDVAVMIHSAADHWSMHVWKKQNGKWQVAATATVPTAPSEARPPSPPVIG